VQAVVDLSKLLPGIPFTGRFHYSDAMVRSLGLVEAARAVVAVLPLPPDRELCLRQQARQRATRHSTRIEGNTLGSAEIGRAVIALDRTQTDMQQEVRNYWRALEWIEEQLEAERQPSEELVRELHSIILVHGMGRRRRRSDYRGAECPVVDSATRRIDYAPPSPKDVPDYVSDLVDWWRGERAASLPGPVRAGLLAHRFVSIHPFPDGNGRTARALATLELWRSGYEMRGFLSLEEHYTADLGAYYRHLQMGLPVDFYDGRHDPDHGQWLGFFLDTMGEAAETLRRQAVALYAPERQPPAPWETLHRVQQQLLTRLLMRGQALGAEAMTFSPGDIAKWFGVSANTAREWLERWRDQGFAVPVDPDAKRVRLYGLEGRWTELLRQALAGAGFSTSINTSETAR
jgi:Fic family protein